VTAASGRLAEFADGAVENKQLMLSVLPKKQEGCDGDPMNQKEGVSSGEGGIKAK
jgi:hypothetical protein